MNQSVIQKEVLIPAEYFNSVDHDVATLDGNDSLHDIDVVTASNVSGDQ